MGSSADAVLTLDLYKYALIDSDYSGWFTPSAIIKVHIRCHQQHEHTELNGTGNGSTPQEEHSYRAGTHDGHDLRRSISDGHGLNTGREGNKGIRCIVHLILVSRSTP